MASPMSLWFCRSLSAVAPKPGDSSANVTIERRVQVMWSSHSLRIWSWKSLRATLGVLTAAASWWAWGVVPRAPALGTVASATPRRALRTIAPHARSRGRDVLVCFIIVPFSDQQGCRRNGAHRCSVLSSARRAAVQWRVDATEEAHDVLVPTRSQSLPASTVLSSSARPPATHSRVAMKDGQACPGRARAAPWGAPCCASRHQPLDGRTVRGRPLATSVFRSALSPERPSGALTGYCHDRRLPRVEDSAEEVRMARQRGAQDRRPGRCWPGPRAACSTPPSSRCPHDAWFSLPVLDIARVTPGAALARDL